MSDAPSSLHPDETEARAVAEGRQGDPFAVLGPHRRGGVLTATVFAPDASSVTALAGGGTHALAPHPAVPSVFSGPVPDRDYRLRIAYPSGAVVEAEDPYRFGPVLGTQDEHFLGEGTLMRLWHRLGAHPLTHEGSRGTVFAVWAPSAARVSVVGDFNLWDGRRAPMRRRGSSGLWELFLPGLAPGTRYQFELAAADGTLLPRKADPVGFGSEHPPQTASIVRNLGGYGWDDADWMAARAARQSRSAPISIYEVHLGSWARVAKEDGRMLSYAEAATRVVDYAADLGFTHIEFMPLSEHPFDGSWGYQPVGLFAPTIRHGTPHEFRDLVAAAHRRGMGVILDWVPGHFPADAHGLARFDGTALYEHADPREGLHRDWNTLIYNFGRTEVENFLVSNALYWLEEFHIDGLRVDAVASMLYRDYSRNEGEWVPNVHGGRENLEAMALLRRMNATVYGEAPGVMTVAEESTAFPGVSRPVHDGGLGFGYKWNMGWMNDTLSYVATDPVHRRHHHDKMTFGLHYAFTENFVLPISHDEVVHGKGSMLGKMPGDMAAKFATLRAYYGFMWGHPGKKLLFMGQEFGQAGEWSHARSLDWHEAEQPPNAGLRRLIRDLNTLYRATPALHAQDCVPEGFTWIDGGDAENAVFSWLRWSSGPDDPPAAVICNFAPVQRDGFAVGLPRIGRWREALNTDAAVYGGGDRGNLGAVTASGTPRHGQPASASLTLPPLSAVFLVHDPEDG